MEHFLNEHRCDSCNKLLFRGMLSMGQIEAKCNRCGNIKIISGVNDGRGGKFAILANNKILKDGTNEDYQKKEREE